jgi:aryl-alcohol dehydrogenase-like predicted oxidoreductase
MTFGKGRLVGNLFNDLDQSTADAMVAKAIDAGVNLFDTADVYTSGQSELMLGKALRSRRDDVVIATKCGFRRGQAVTASGLSRRYVLSSVEKSLRRLDTDWIDLFLLHIPDPQTPLEETARALEDVVRQGSVRYVGFCNYPAWEAQKLLCLQQALGCSPCIASQMYYSLLGRDLEREFVPFLRSSGLGLMVWSPLAGGFLAGKYTRDNPAPGRRAKFDFPPIDLDRGYGVVDLLRALADKHRATPAQVALAWTLSRPFVSSVLVGATTLDQLDDNLDALEVELEAEDIRALDALSEPAATYPAWMQPMGVDQAVSDALGNG